MKEKNYIKNRLPNDPVAITGIGGRFPQSSNVDEFWNNLLSGKELYTEDDSRWPIGHMNLPKKAGKVPDIGKFDANFFGMSDKEANDSDPQFKICLETTYEAIVDAGLDPSDIRGSRTGMFIGYCYSDSKMAQLQLDALANDIRRKEDFSDVSTFFGFKGPTFTYDSACASSFSAFNEAVKLIQCSVIDTAIVAGVAVCTDPDIAVGFRELGMTNDASESRCLDERAAGYVRSETISTVVLQRKSVAKRIYANVLNTKTNSDGYKKEGITFPGRDTMMTLITETFEEINLDPTSVKYIEAHVRGTQAGDPVESGAIERIFRPGDRNDPILVGCLKSNMGHAEGASGSAALAKVCKILQNGLIPPNINYVDPNPNIPGLFNGKLKPVLSATKFEDKLVSLDSFGFGGSNIHIIMEKSDTCINGNIHDLTGYKGINRLILFKSRTEDGFKLLMTKIVDQKWEITTEFLDLLDNASHIKCSSNSLPWRGYFIVNNQSKKLLKSYWRQSGSMDESRKIHHINIYCSNPCKSWIQNVGNTILQANVPVDYIDTLEMSYEKAIIEILDGKKKVGNKINITSDTSKDVILELIGTLFIDGNNDIEIKKLYPLIKYPVSSSTASISPFIKWNHEDTWVVYKFPVYYRLVHRNKTFHFDYSSTHNHLCGHVIDGRIIFPAAQYLWTIWQSLAIELIEHSPTAFLQSGVKFWNVKLLRALIVTNREEISIVTRVNHFTGFFEIMQRDTCLVTGFVKLTWDESVPSLGDIPKDLETKKMISKKEFYKELRVRGYDYEDKFQGVDECNIDGTFGIVSFLKNWVCFTDAVFQLTLINDDTRSLLLPTEFEYLQVDASEFKDISEAEYGIYKNISKSATLEDGENIFLSGEPTSVTEDESDRNKEEERKKRTFNVTVDPNTREVFTKGLYIKGMGANPAPRKKVIPLVGKFTFVPFNQEIDEEDEMQMLKSSYITTCQEAMESLNESTQEAMKSIDDGSDHSLLKVIQKLSNHGTLVSKLSFSEYMKELSNDFLLNVPINNVAVSHPLKLVTDSFHSLDLNVIEINMSSKINVKNDVVAAVDKFKTGKPLVNYKIYSNNNYDGDDALLSEFLSLKIVDSHLIIVQHPNLGFTFLNTDRSLEEKEVEFEKVISSTLSIISVGTFVMIMFSSKEMDINGSDDGKMKFVSTDCTFKKNEIMKMAKKSQDIELICVKRYGSLNVLLARKVKKLDTTEPPIIHEVETFSYKWVDEIKEKIYLEEDNIKEENGEKSVTRKPLNNKPIYLVSKDNDSNGLPGFINCVRNEDKRFRGIVVSGVTCNDTLKRIIETCITYDLQMAIFQNGVLGSIFGCPKDINETKSSKNRNEFVKKEDISYVLDVETKGDLGSLKYYKQVLKMINGNESIINVHYSSLNFKDIMVASGRVSLIAYPKEIQMLPGNLGMEFSGFDQRTKQRVMGIIPADGIATKILLPSNSSDFIFEVPDEMSLEDAATIPVAYSTVYYALIMRGKLVDGESILIHAGSGGVGQAAIRICLSMNCEIYTTVGSKEKRDFIKSMYPSIHDDHIFDSRSISFGDDLLRATDGRGVDVVLNSLSEEKLKVGLTCLAGSGRFIEIGKYDMLTNSSFDPSSLTNNQTFQSICLAFFMTKVANAKDNNDVHALKESKTLNELMKEGLLNGVVKPLNKHVFNWNQSEEAFRFMATGKHMGKVLLKMKTENGDEEKNGNIEKKISTESKVRIEFDPRKSYIVIGGLGGMGLELCYWLVRKGVRKLLITSRTGLKTSYHQFCIDRLIKMGSKVTILTSDVSDIKQAKKLVDLSMEQGPVGGIFNLAMVLRDAMFENQTKEMFEECCKIKIIGTDNLDQLSRALCPQLDHFVCFSSLVSTFGNAGQCNYAYANSFMDNVCTRRREQGLPGLAVGWGAIGDVGHVAERMGNDVTIVGTAPQRINSCFDVLENILLGNDSVVGSWIPVDVNKIRGDGKNILGTIMNVLGIKDHSKISPKSTLGDLGLDSLMAVEIKQLLEKKYDKIMSTKEIREMSIEDISNVTKNVTDAKGTLRELNDNSSNMVMGVIDVNLPVDPFTILNDVKDSHEPIFIFPPAEGTFAVLQGMITKLSNLSKRPLIGVNWTKDNDSHQSVEEVSKYYLGLIKKNYPNLKSLSMIAYSIGSLFAMNIALLIQDENEINNNSLKLSKLIVLDFSPLYGWELIRGNIKVAKDDNDFVFMVIKHIAASVAEGIYSYDEKIVKVPENEFIQKTFKYLSGMFSEIEFIELCDRLRLKAKMIHNYNPGVQLNDPLRVLLIKSNTKIGVEDGINNDYGFKNYCTSLNVITYNGDHKSFLYDHPDDIAADINSFIS